jgi:hypothetical protein
MSYKAISINREKWFARSLADQLGNIGSEVDRYISLTKRNQNENALNAIYRAIDLLDLSKQNPNLSSAQRREIAITKEALTDCVLSDNSYGNSLEYFSKYFMQFAMVARKRHYNKQ